MQQSSIPIGDFASLARSAGGLQAPNGSNVASPSLPAHVDASPPSATVQTFAAMAARAGGQLPPAPTPAPAAIPATSEPILSDRNYAPVDTMPNVLSGG